MAPSVTRAASIETLRAVYHAGKLRASAVKRFPPDEDLNGRVAIWKGSITQLECDAIVNAANSSLLGGGGVDGAIHAAAGHELYKECKTLDGCETGDAKITKGYKLPAKHVLHAVGPIYNSSEKERKAKQLKSCYQRCLELATEHKLKSVAFNCISTGIFGYPIRAATEIAMETVRNYLLSEDGKEIDLVIFVIFLQKDLEVYNSLAPEFFPPSSDQAESAEEAAKETENTAGAVEGEQAVEGDKVSKSVEAEKGEGAPATEEAPAAKETDDTKETDTVKEADKPEAKRAKTDESS